jgi:sugar phosphate isomerase/epimerase
MKIGAVSLGWSGKSLPFIFNTIASMGGDCVDINGNTERHHSIAITNQTASRIKQWADDAGITIGSLTGYNDFAKIDSSELDGEIERLITTCKAASELQVPVVRAFVGDVKPGVSYMDVHENIVQAFRIVCSKAAEFGITLGIENHGRLINDGPKLARLIAEVDAPNLGMTLDTGNFAWAGHNAAEVHHDFEVLLPHIVCLHVKDGIWTNDGFEFLPAGEGDLPLYWLLKKMSTSGYNGMVYSEFEGKGDFMTGTAVSIKHLKEINLQIQNA